MEAAKRAPVSVADYLAGELVSPVKHEDRGGFVYAMAGVRNAHNLIATNTVVALGSRLRGQPCRPFNSDTKVRIRMPTQTRFYYPDVSVVCRPNSQADQYQDEPAVIVEVMSESTRRIDEGEKKYAYLTIPSLSVYPLAEQSAALVNVYRRTASGFTHEKHEGLGTVIPLREIEIDLPLAEMYDTVEFSDESA